ncbi:MAG: hypothetical protein ACFBSC_08340 [Microcoleaceae cyanobacterium]
MTYEQPPKTSLPGFQHNRIPLTVTFSQGCDRLSRTFPYTLTHEEMGHYLECLEIILSFTPDNVKAALNFWQWHQLNLAAGEDQ